MLEFATAAVIVTVVLDTEHAAAPPEIFIPCAVTIQIGVAVNALVKVNVQEVPAAIAHVPLVLLA